MDVYSTIDILLVLELKTTEPAVANHPVRLTRR